MELYDGLTQDRGNKWFVGEPLQVELLYKYDGVWQMEEAEEAKKYGYVPGNPKVKDVNQNGKYVKTPPHKSTILFFDHNRYDYINTNSNLNSYT